MEPEQAEAPKEEQRVLLAEKEPEKDTDLETLCIYPNPLISKVSAEVTQFDESLTNLIALMDRVMKKSKGIGIAAPQVSQSLRVIKWNIPVKDCPNDNGTLVNPVITWRSDETQEVTEGCLSFPGLRVSVKRSKSIKFLGFDEKGVPYLEREASDLLAACIQHEVDHLNGVTLISQISGLKRDMYKRKVNKYFKELKLQEKNFKQYNKIINKNESRSNSPIEELVIE